MNTKNNSRRRRSKELIEGVFVELLQAHEIDEITVSEICKRTGLNRSTFYANYEDIYALADTIRERLEAEVAQLSNNDMTGFLYGEDYIGLFRHIKDNQLFYKTYFKLGYDSSHKIDFGALAISGMIADDGYLDYHVEFFKAGFNAMIKKWLSGDCVESPETIAEILKTEYRGRG